VHRSDREVGKIDQATLGIHARPNAFAAALRGVTGDWKAWRANARADWEASFEAPAQPSPVDMVAVTAHLRDVLPDDAILTNGAGNFTVWPNKFCKFGLEARLLAPQSGAMVYGLPAAIVAKIAFPERVVICFAGGRRLSDELPGAWHGDADWRSANRAHCQQRHLSDDPGPPGAAVSGPCLRNEHAEPGFHDAGSRLELPFRAGGKDGGFRGGL
jgi:hypothetical protein